MMETISVVTGIVRQPDEDDATAIASVTAGIRPATLNPVVIESDATVTTVRLTGTAESVELALWRIYAADCLTENGATYGEEIAERIADAVASATA